MGVFIDSFQAVKALIDAVSAKLGANTDLWGGATKTALSYSNTSYKHMHNPSHVLPADCTFFSATADATADTFGAWVDIDTNTAKSLDFHWVNIYEITKLGNYILQFYTLDGGGAAETYLGEISVSRLDNFSKASQVYLQVPVIAEGSHVAARVKASNTNEGIVRFTLTYHDYT